MFRRRNKDRAYSRTAYTGVESTPANRHNASPAAIAAAGLAGGDRNNSMSSRLSSAAAAAAIHRHNSLTLDSYQPAQGFPRSNSLQSNHSLRSNSSFRGLAASSSVASLRTDAPGSRRYNSISSAPKVTTTVETSNSGRTMSLTTTTVRRFGAFELVKTNTTTGQVRAPQTRQRRPQSFQLRPGYASSAMSFESDLNPVYEEEPSPVTVRSGRGHNAAGPRISFSPLVEEPVEPVQQKKHVPPPRSISPMRSALKDSRSPSVSSSIDDAGNLQVPTDTSVASVSSSILNSAGKSKKQNRVSFVGSTSDSEDDRLDTHHTTHLSVNQAAARQAAVKNQSSKSLAASTSLIADRRKKISATAAAATAARSPKLSGSMNPPASSKSSPRLSSHNVFQKFDESDSGGSVYSDAMDNFDVQQQSIDSVMLSRSRSSKKKEQLHVPATTPGSQLARGNGSLRKSPSTASKRKSGLFSKNTAPAAAATAQTEVVAPQKHSGPSSSTAITTAAAKKAALSIGTATGVVAGAGKKKKDQQNGTISKTVAVAATVTAAASTTRDVSSKGVETDQAQSKITSVATTEIIKESSENPDGVATNYVDISEDRASTITAPDGLGAHHYRSLADSEEDDGDNTAVSANEPDSYYEATHQLDGFEVSSDPHASSSSAIDLGEFTEPSSIEPSSEAEKEQRVKNEPDTIYRTLDPASPESKRRDSVDTVGDTTKPQQVPTSSEISTSIQAQQKNNRAGNSSSSSDFSASNGGLGGSYSADYDADIDDTISLNSDSSWKKERGTRKPRREFKLSMRSDDTTQISPRKRVPVLRGAPPPLSQAKHLGANNQGSFKQLSMRKQPAQQAPQQQQYRFSQHDGPEVSTQQYSNTIGGFRSRFADSDSDDEPFSGVSKPNITTSSTSNSNTHPIDNSNKASLLVSLRNRTSKSSLRHVSDPVQYNMVSNSEPIATIPNDEPLSANNLAPIEEGSPRKAGGSKFKNVFSPNNQAKILVKKSGGAGPQSPVREAAPVAPVYDAPAAQSVGGTPKKKKFSGLRKVFRLD